MPAPIPAGSYVDSARLREWRDISGLRIEEVCSRAQVSYPYLRALEAGARINPTIDTLTRIAAVYGHAASDLILPIGAAS